MWSRGQFTDLPSGNNDAYKMAAESYHNEIRTLGERNNFLLIVQSILIAAGTWTFTQQTNFPFIFPFIVTGIILLGSTFCYLQHKSGQVGALSAFMWKQYMRHLEKSTTNMLWDWADYFSNVLERGKGTSSISKFLLQRAPLPSAWLFFPLIFSVVWVIASLYIPVRFILDTSFYQSGIEYRCAAAIFAWVTVACTLAVFVFITLSLISWLRSPKHSMPTRTS
jgi:hypothetical protein